MCSDIRIVVFSIYYNREGHVDRTVESLLGQTYKNIRIVLVDDGSTDATLLKLNTYAWDPRVVVVSGPNKGFTATLIQSIEEYGDAGYIAIQGSGDVSLPDRLLKQKKYLDENHDVAVVGCRVEQYNQNDGTSNISGVDKLLRVNVYDLMKGNVFTHGEVMFRRSSYDVCGGYRAYFKYSQDRDLWCRMSIEHDLVRLPDVLYRRYEIEGALSNTSSKFIEHGMYSEMALVSCESLLIDGVDPIGQYGVMAVAICPPTSRLSRNLMRVSLWRFMYDCDNSYINELYFRRRIMKYGRGRIVLIYLASKVLPRVLRGGLYIIWKSVVKVKKVFNFSFF